MVSIRIIVGLLSLLFSTSTISSGREKLQTQICVTNNTFFTLTSMSICPLNKSKCKFGNLSPKILLAPIAPYSVTFKTQDSGKIKCTPNLKLSKETFEILLDAGSNLVCYNIVLNINNKAKTNQSLVDCEYIIKEKLN